MIPSEREQMVERGARAIAPSAFIEDEGASEDVLHIRAHDRAVALRDASMVLHVAGWRPERVVKAEAWAEGFDAGHACTGATVTALCAGRKPNPYRVRGAGDAA